MNIQEVIVDKIDELCDLSISFLEKERNLLLEEERDTYEWTSSYFEEDRKLSPASKFQACILTSVEIIFIIEFNEGKDYLYGEKMKKLLSLLEVKLLKRFKDYSEEFKKSNYKLDDVNNEFLNDMMISSNNKLLSYSDKDVKNAIIIGINEIWKELKDVQYGYERYNSRQGKLIYPEIIFISLYIHPFFNNAVKNEDKPKLCSWIKQEVESSYLDYFEVRFMEVLGKLGDFLLLKLNTDENFKSKIKEAANN